MKSSSVFKSISFAARGFLSMAQKERNFKVELFLAGIYCILGLFLRFYFWEWLVVFVLCGAVLSLEMINTSIEETCNLLRDKLNLKYEDTTLIRNLSAGSVFLLAAFSAIIGILIILSHL